MLDDEEKPAWIATGSLEAIAQEISLEELGFGMTLLACMWRDGLAAIPNDPAKMLQLVDGSLASSDKIDEIWIRSRWTGLSKLFRERPDGMFEPNPLMFSPPSDDEPPSAHH